MRFSSLNSKFLALLVLNLVFSSLKCEIYTSTWELFKLGESAQKVTQDLIRFIKSNEDWDEVIEKAFRKFHDIGNLANQDVKKFIANPINSFLLIKLLTYDIERLFTHIEANYEIEKYLQELKKKYYLPSVEDYTGVIDSIYRLQKIYKVDIGQFQMGNLSQNYPSRKLIASDCVDIGKNAYTFNNFNTSFEWFKIAYDVLSKDDDPFLKKTDFLYLFINSAIKLRKFGLAEALLHEMLLEDPGNDKAKRMLKSLQEKKNKSGKLEKFETNENEYTLILESLCRSENSPTPKAKQLKCKYLKNTHYFLIAPIKAEQVYLNPPIWVYYDVVNRNQMGILKKLSAGKFSKAIIADATKKNKMTSTRDNVMKIAWLHGISYKSLDRLTNLISQITNLNMESAESWQIENYGVGGFYSPHYDVLSEKNLNRRYREQHGNRLATVMIHLEAPELGGNIVFPQLRFSIKPKLGSAVFWYNFNAKGEPDMLIEHATCPALVGLQTIAIKWIGRNGQRCYTKIRNKI